MLYSNVYFAEPYIFTRCRSKASCSKEKYHQKATKFFSKSYSVKTFSIRKQVLDMLDIALEFTESEVKQSGTFSS